VTGCNGLHGLRHVTVSGNDLLDRQLLAFRAEARRSNCSRPRGDYAFPEIRGVVEAPDDGFVLFSVTGMSSLAPGSEGHVMTFKPTMPSLLAERHRRHRRGQHRPRPSGAGHALYACAVGYLPSIEPPADR
jgi:hypothetical protein